MAWTRQLRLSFRHFNAKLRAKGQAEWKRRQAHHGVVLYFQVLAGIGTERIGRCGVSDELVVSAGALMVLPPGDGQVAASIPVDRIREEHVLRLGSPRGKTDDSARKVVRECASRDSDCGSALRPKDRSDQEISKQAA